MNYIKNNIKKILVCLCVSVIIFIATTPKEILMKSSVYTLPIIFVIVYVMDSISSKLFSKSDK